MILNCNSNDSDTDVDVIFDKNTSIEEINCNKADLSLDRSRENLETETNITISTENIKTNISNDNYNLQSTNGQPEKIQQKFVTVELFNTFYYDYIEYKHYINDFLENLKACVCYFLSNLYFQPNDSPSKTMKNVFYFI